MPYLRYPTKFEEEFELCTHKEIQDKKVMAIKLRLARETIDI